MDTVVAENPGGEKIEFREKDHSYTVLSTSRKLISATTWIGKFFPKFNSPVVARKCAGKGKYVGMSQEEVLAAWEAEGYRGRTEGTCAHQYAESRLLGTPPPEPISERVEQLFVSVDLGIDRLCRYYRLVASEDIVFSTDMGIAGTIDLLMFHPETRSLLILDWKNNKEIKTGNKWETAFPPINHLENCDFAKYSLQFSLYKRLVLAGDYYRDTGFENIKMGLLHLRPGEAPAMMPITSLDEEISSMLRYKRSPTTLPAP
jgi:hypothetical protein